MTMNSVCALIPSTVCHDDVSLEAYLHAHDVLGELGRNEVSQWIWDAILRPTRNAASAVSGMIDGHYATGIIPKREELTSEAPAKPAHEAINEAIMALAAEVRSESRVNASRELLAEVLAWLVCIGAEMELKARPADVLETVRE